MDTTNVFLPEVGHAVSCDTVKSHQPRPLRFVWHHILPRACGGKTVTDNLVSLCDNCHYAVHVLLWTLAQNLELPNHVSSKQLALAQQGYEKAVAAGTVSSIPQESSS